MKDPQGMKFPFQDAFKYYDTLKNYNPMTNWQRFFNPQFFINYNAADVEVENNVLQKVGSYGKQLGKIIDVLDVLITRLPANELTLQEQIALKEFHTLTDQVREAVAAVKGPQKKSITQADIDRLLDELQALALSNPDAHRRLVEQLKRAIARDNTEKMGDQDLSATFRDK